MITIEQGTSVTGGSRMHHMNEDAAWQRFQDLQREMENRRLLAAGRPSVTLEIIRRLAARVWLLRVAMRPHQAHPREGDQPSLGLRVLAMRRYTADNSPSRP